MSFFEFVVPYTKTNRNALVADLEQYRKETINRNVGGSRYQHVAVHTPVDYGKNDACEGFSNSEWTDDRIAASPKPVDLLQDLPLLFMSQDDRRPIHELLEHVFVAIWDYRDLEEKLCQRDEQLLDQSMINTSV